MDADRINLRSERELGTILSDGFSFLKVNHKPMLRILIKTSLFPFIVYLIAVALITSDTTGYSFFVQDFSIFYIITTAVMIFSWLAYNILGATSVWGYMSQYANLSQRLDEGRVVRLAFQDSLKLFGFTIIASIMLVLGFIAFVFPAVFLFVPLYVSAVAIVIEKKNINEGISRGFELIKGEWWVSFGTILTLSIVMTIISLTVQTPLYAYTFLKNLVLASEEPLLSVGGNDLLLVLISIVTSAFSYVVFVIHLILAGLVYFDLDEQKSSTGLFDKIEKLEKSDL